TSSQPSPDAAASLLLPPSQEFPRSARRSLSVLRIRALPTKHEASVAHRVHFELDPIAGPAPSHPTNRRCETFAPRERPCCSANARLNATSRPDLELLRASLPILERDFPRNDAAPRHRRREWLPQDASSTRRLG